ncbi:hypothetical protein FSARC_353 [Fusarium sarcochroum]|uniref:Heterokaryon incompatibility domain-containing protein n=1 Tax=Fusarium sarcochroum TaxID=1208366 RepID=A0A8H4UC02_9HYPO|nr:hypothetical protein FSARC_353 [Fusarium sarcochroum]
MKSTDETDTSCIDGDEASAGIIAPPNADCDMCSKIMDMVQTPYEESIVTSSIYLGKVGDLLSVFSTSYHFELVSRPEIPDHPGTVRVLDDDWINLDMIKEWLSRCSQLHGDKCNRSIGDLESFKPQLLVDVVKGCVAVCDEESPRFLTLSYTWGQTKNFRATKSNVEQLQEPGALRSDYVAAQLPKTILDAIELTRALGETWLWIDSLCIVQDDEEVLAHELAEMHRIYASSFLTIIAADGDDAEHGLRGLKGISSERTINQTVVPLSGDERIRWIEHSPSDRPFDERGYYQRMWTSQEYDFSKRRLLFKSGTVEWQCDCATWSEDHLYHVEADEPSIRASSNRSYVGRGVHSHVPSLNTLNNLTRSFNIKDLRFEEDVFNAFAGYSTYLNSIFPAGLVYGHPQLFFDISLCWYSIHSVRRRKVSRQYAGDPVHTRLPSWSWMGWQGKTTFPWDSEGEHTGSTDLGFTDTVTEWYAMESPGSTKRQLIESTWSQYRKSPPDSMADIWRCDEYKPPATLKLNSSDDLLEPRSMPKELPSYVFTYIPDDGQAPPLSRWYPIPVKNTISEDGSEPGLHGGYQYLWCQTFRAYLFASPNLISEFGGRSYVHPLQDINGTTVGALHLQNEDDDKLFQEETKVELIAVAKGWSAILRRYTGNAPSPGHYKPLEDSFLTEQEEEEALERHQEEWATFFEEPSWTDEWERSKEDKQDCYHVLWVEWENGVAYRRAYGFVLVDEWERLAEPSKVDITLG